MFLEGKHWQAACDVSFTYNRAMLAIALHRITGMILTRIEAADGEFIRRPGIASEPVVLVSHDDAPAAEA